MYRGDHKATGVDNLITLSNFILSPVALHSYQHSVLCKEWRSQSDKTIEPGKRTRGNDTECVAMCFMKLFNSRVNCFDVLQIQDADDMSLKMNLFATASTETIGISGLIIFKGIIGRPAPDPMSSRRSLAVM